MQEQSQLAVRRFLDRARHHFRSQEEMARLISRLGHPIKRSAVGHWLTGRVERVPAWVVFALASELRIPLTDFIAGQSWEERLTAAERQLAVLRAWALTQGMQATEEQMTSEQ